MMLYTFLPEELIDELTSVEGEALREAKRVARLRIDSPDPRRRGRS